MINLLQSTRSVSFISRFMMVTGLALLVFTYPGFSQTDEYPSPMPGDNPTYDNQAYSDSADDVSNNAVGDFYDSLMPYGQWILMPDNTWAWEPYDMPVDWRPYTLGHWVYTDYGWTWVSDEPWGWACFHYGRWDYDDDYGWIWYPGREWAPAWVIWRTNDDWIGWAPCPRRLRWRDDRGFDFRNFNIQIMIKSHNFCFVPTRHIFDRDLHRRIMPVTWNTRVIPLTKPEVRYTFENHRIVNQLPIEQSRLERIVGRPIQRMNLIASTRPTTGVRIQNRDNTVQLYKPDFRTMPKTEIQQRFQNMPRITAPIPPNTITNQQRSALRSIQAAQDAENRALQQKHLLEQQALQEQHQREIIRPPVNIPREQIQQQQQQENQALKEKMQREQRVLQNYHERENVIKTAPAAPPERRFKIQPSQSKEPYQRVQQYEKEQGTQGNAPVTEQRNKENVLRKLQNR